MRSPLEATQVDVDDVLRAVAINSSYATSRALSKWMRRGVRLHTDGFVKQPFSELSHAAGPPDEPVAAIHMMLEGDIQGDFLLTMPEAVGYSLVDILTGAEPGTTTSFSEFAQSCLQETGNIVGTSFANSLAQWFNLTVVPAAPTFIHDLGCAVVEPLLYQEAVVSDSAWLSKTEFELESQRLDWSMLLLLSAESLSLIRSSCDREEVRRNALHFVAINAAFRASRSLSKWLKKGVRLTTDGFEHIKIRDAHLQFDADDPVVCMHMTLMNQMTGHLLLVMTEPTAIELANRLMPGCQPPGEHLGPMGKSCLQETANIVATSFTNSVAKWLELETEPTSPEIVLDLPQAVFESVLADQAAVSDEVLMSKTVFRLDGERLECAFYVLPTPASYRLIEAFCS